MRVELFGCPGNKNYSTSYIFQSSVSFRSCQVKKLQFNDIFMSCATKNRVGLHFAGVSQKVEDVNRRWHINVSSCKKKKTP